MFTYFIDIIAQTTIEIRAIYISYLVVRVDVKLRLDIYLLVKIWNFMIVISAKGKICIMFSSYLPRQGIILKYMKFHAYIGLIPVIRMNQTNSQTA